MSNNLSMIGIEASELRWIRSLVLLLRHPDPNVPELARQALIYVEAAACKRETLGHSGSPAASASISSESDYPLVNAARPRLARTGD
jgi:hypothetical protein